MDNRQPGEEGSMRESVDIKTESEVERESDDVESAYDGTTEEDSDTTDSYFKPEEDEIDVTEGNFGLDRCESSRPQHPFKVEKEFTEGREKQGSLGVTEEDEGADAGKKRRGRKRKGKQGENSDSSSCTQSEQPIKRGKRKKKDDLEMPTFSDENEFKNDKKSNNKSDNNVYDPSKTYYCFHKRCMEAFASYIELKTHCANDHNYAGSLRCGRCHNVYGDEETYEEHKSVCSAKLQCIDCGRTFPERKDFVGHVALPRCDKQSDYKLLYHQTSKIITYSFSKTAENKIVTQTRSHQRVESLKGADKQDDDEDYDPVSDKNRQ